MTEHHDGCWREHDECRDKKAIADLRKVVTDVDDVVIEAFVTRISRAGKDPLMYAMAFALKAKRLERGPDGFFYKMATGNHEDEWLAGSLKRVAREQEKTVKKAWPYPRGKQSCKWCRGYGWYGVREDAMDDVHEEMLDKHQMDGFAPAVVDNGALEIRRIVFICPECNPAGAMVDGFEDKVFPRYPVGGAPSE